MCEFFSCLVLRSGEVFWLPGVNGHRDLHDALIKKMPNMKDHTADPDKLLFARVEITPPNNDVFEKDIKSWIFRIDETITPTWWTKDHEKKARRALSDCLSECIIDGQTLSLIENRKGLFIKNSKIKVVKNSDIVSLWENSSVGTLRENSSVGTLWENSSVGELRENSSVGTLRENSSVGTLRGSSSVGTLWDNSSVGELRENSSVGELWENSSVGTLRDNSSVGTLRENSSVGTLWDNSSVGELRGSSLINGVYSPDALYAIEKGSNGLVILRYGGNIEIVHNAKNKVELIKFKSKGGKNE